MCSQYMKQYCQNIKTISKLLGYIRGARIDELVFTCVIAVN